MKQNNLMSEYMTLGKGARAKKFWAVTNNDGISILTGEDGKTAFEISNSKIEKFLNLYKDKNWFVLGNSVDNVKVGSMGEYFKDTLKISVKFASHISAVLVYQKRLEFRYVGNSIELRAL